MTREQCIEWLRRHQPFDNVYFMHNPQSQLTKIGRTTHLQRRRSEVERQCGSKVQLVGLFATPNGKGAILETKFHREYEKYRCVGEWFRIPLGFVEIMAEMHGGEEGFTWPMHFPPDVDDFIRHLAHEARKGKA